VIHGIHLRRNIHVKNEKELKPTVSSIRDMQNSLMEYWGRGEREREKMREGKEGRKAGRK
jgi:hypothetical protein